MQAFKYCFAILLLCLPLQAFAEFCTIDKFGNIGLCFPTSDICRMSPNAGGGCIFRQGGAGSQGGNTGPSDFDKAMEPLRELGKSWQRESKELRASTPDFLLPLSSEPMSRETVAIITSTLNTALEMDSARTPRNWKNPTTGSQGLVVADDQQTSQYGSICREFVVTMDYRGKRTGVKGNACRVAGEWKISGSTPLEFRDGKIVQAEAAPSAIRNPEAKRGSPSGMREGYSTSPFSSTNLIIVADKKWTRCLVGQSWDSTDNGKCNGRVSVKQFEERMNLLKLLPDELRGGDWRIPTRREMLDFFNKLNVEGRLAEIGSGGNCEWSNDAIDENSAYARISWPSDTYFQLYAKKKSSHCGVRLVSDSPKRDGKIVENNAPNKAASERSADSASDKRWVTVGSDNKRQWRIDNGSFRQDNEYSIATVSQVMASEAEIMLGGKLVKGIKEIHQTLAVDCAKEQFIFPASTFMDAGGGILYTTSAPRSKWSENLRPSKKSGDPFNDVLRMICNR